MLMLWCWTDEARWQASRASRGVCESGESCELRELSQLNRDASRRRHMLDAIRQLTQKEITKNGTMMSLVMMTSFVISEDSNPGPEPPKFGNGKPNHCAMSCPQDPCE